MLSKCIFLVCLLASVVTAAKLPFGMVVNRDQSGQDQDIKLSHGNVPGIDNSSLTIKCGEDGGVSFTLASPNPTKTATIAVSASKDVPATAACTSTAFAFPLAVDDTAVYALTPEDSEGCGRTLVGADIATGPAHFTWWVVVKETVQVNRVSVRQFSSEIRVACRPNLADSTAPEFDQNPEVPPVNEGEASFVQAIGFSLTKSDQLVDKKWQFTLRPSSPSSLAGSNFKIVACKATPTSDETVTADLIINNCISDPGTTVNSANSPDSQVIDIHPFQFSEFPADKVVLTCSVELCSNEEGSNCGEISVCIALPPPVPEENPANKRTRRSSKSLYYATSI